MRPTHDTPTRLTRRLLRVAASLGALVAVAYLVLAPTQREPLTDTQQSLRGRAEWSEWRDDAFHERVATFDRSNPAAVVASYLDAFRRGSVLEALGFTSDAFQRNTTPRSLRAAIRSRDDTNETLVVAHLSDALITDDGDVALVRVYERLSNNKTRIRRARVVRDPAADAWGFDGFTPNGHNDPLGRPRNVAPPVVRDGALTPPADPSALVDHFLAALRANNAASVYVLCSDRAQRELAPDQIDSALTLYAPTAVRTSDASVRVDADEQRAHAHIDFNVSGAVVTLSLLLTRDEITGAWWIDQILPNDAHNLHRAINADNDDTDTPG